MVNVIFYNLIRSKYKIKDMKVQPNNVHDIIKEILNRNTEMAASDFKTCVVFYKGKPLHHAHFHKEIKEEEEIIITHFVGGG